MVACEVSADSDRSSVITGEVEPALELLWAATAADPAEMQTTAREPVVIDSSEEDEEDEVATEYRIDAAEQVHKRPAVALSYGGLFF